MNKAPLLFGLLLLVTPAHAEDPPLTTAPLTTPTVTTHATARDRLPNTVADVQLGVETHRPTLAAVRAALSQGSTNLMNYLRDTGADRITTQNLSVEPELDEPSRGRPARIVGYIGKLSVSCRVETANLGVVLGDVLSHGANTIDGTTQHPRESEVDGARERLAASATRIALSQARAVAEAAGLKAGQPRQLEVASPDIELARPMIAFAPKVSIGAAPSPSIATNAGDTEIAATVNATVTLLTPEPVERVR